MTDAPIDRANYARPTWKSVAGRTKDKQTQDMPEELNRSGSSRRDGRHQKTSQYVENDNRGIRGTSSSSVAVTTPCSGSEDKSSLSEDSSCRSDLNPADRGRREGQVVESSAPDTSSLNRGENPVDDLNEGFLCALEKSDMDPPEEESSNAPPKLPNFEHEPGDYTMVDYAASSPICQTSLS